MLQHHALGHAGGAGGIKQDEEVFGLGAFRHGAFGQLFQLFRGEHGALVVFEQRQQFLVGHKEARRGVGNHELQPFLRVGRVQRLVGASGLEDA